MLSELQQSLQSELDRIRRYCVSTDQTIAVAESVTAGCLQLLLSTAPFAQQFFQGGITVYNCAQKAIHLNVEPISADKCNGVSADISIVMARNVCDLFRSTIGIAVTGYATRAPDEGINRLHAYYTIVRQGAVVGSGDIEPEGEGIDAQWSYSATILSHLAKTLESL